MNADKLRGLLSAWAVLMTEKRDWLIELDSVVGDSDLGLTMSDGFTAASEAAAASDLTDVGKLSYQAGKAMATAVPSTMGTLMASGLMNAGKVLRAWKTRRTRTFSRRTWKGCRTGERRRSVRKPSWTGFSLPWKR